MLTFKKLGKYGRLGNQLFQISSTIGIANKNNLKYFFPTWSYENFFEKQVPKLNNTNIDDIIFENHFHYHDIILPNKNFNYSLEGYFQSEKYFIDSKEEIKDFFNLKSVLKNEVEKRYGNILNNSCSLHIRRGDYLNYPSHHPTQNLNYYENGVEMLYGENTENVNFLIFSDDIDWCKNNLKFNNSYFISGNIDIIDLYLMSKCNNNIIANSSFSWWGAWLNETDTKKIIAPKNWFGSALNHDTSDLIPKSWNII